MKDITLIILCFSTFLIFSCNNDDSDNLNPQPYILSETTIVFQLLSSGGDFHCNDSSNLGGAYLIFKGNSNFKFKTQDEIPDSITNKFNFWYYDYQATLRFIPNNNCFVRSIYQNREFVDTFPIAQIISIKQKI